VASATLTAEAAIEARLGDNWSTTPISWPGVDFTPPDGPWIEMHVLWGEGVGETMGSGGVNTISGVLVIRLFDRPGSGYGVIAGYVDTLRDLFDRAVVGAVEFLAASGPKKTEREDKKDKSRWIGLNISVPFTLEENS